jgi:hypothetical protein
MARVTLHSHALLVRNCRTPNHHGQLTSVDTRQAAQIPVLIQRRTRSSAATS